MLRPINDRIIAEESPVYEPKKGALILPTLGNENLTYDVIAICHDEKFVEVGDRIIINKYAAVEKEIDGKKYFIINSRDVLAIIEKDIENETV